MPTRRRFIAAAGLAAGPALNARPAFAGDTPANRPPAVRPVEPGPGVRARLHRVVLDELGGAR
ncbi:hypothetical protein [Streptomyces sp. NPDC059166]|uniref:hypothetical protein n=1 Tax=Streptomyces sp. NPDC059166 TaxID=3346752 RepID=UPI003696DB03